MSSVSLVRVASTGLMEICIVFLIIKSNDTRHFIPLLSIEELKLVFFHFMPELQIKPDFLMMFQMGIGLGQKIKKKIKKIKNKKNLSKLILFIA